MKRSEPLSLRRGRPKGVRLCVAGRLARAHAKSGLSVADAIALYRVRWNVGIKPSTYYAWLAGTRSPDPLLVKRMVALLARR